MPKSRSTTGAFLALVAAALFGVSGAIAAGVFDAVEPARVAQARSLIAAALLVPYAAYRGVLDPRGGIVKFMILGVNLALVNVTFYWAIDRLGVGPGATVQFLGPILVLVWLVVVRKHHVGAVAWSAAVAAVVGVGMVTQAWSMRDADGVGIAAGLAAAALFASYLLYGEHLAERFPPVQMASWGFIFASVLWAIVLPWWTFPTDIGGQAVAGLLFIGILGTTLPFIIEFAALSLTSSGVVGIIATAEPPIGAISAAILLDQHLEQMQWVGVAVVVVAVATVQRWGLRDIHPATPIA